MIKSMTGYGRAKQQIHGREITAEVRAVNHRYLDINIKSPRIYGFLEDPIKAAVQAAASRGKIDVFIMIENNQTENVKITLNKPVLDGYMTAFDEIKQLYDVKDDVSLTSIARLPDVLNMTKEDEDAQELTEDVISVLNEALCGFETMRIREGENMMRDILMRTDIILEDISAVEARSPITVEEYQQKFKLRIEELLNGVELDPQRIVTEAAIFADKVAVTEEIIRARSHISQLKHMLGEKVPIGRKLDFLIQELNREVNTMGSKGSDLEIARTVIHLKAEIEKVREQIQNVE